MSTEKRDEEVVPPGTPKKPEVIDPIPEENKEKRLGKKGRSFTGTCPLLDLHR